MEPWYKVMTPRAEVREGSSFNPDEFAIPLEHSRLTRTHRNGPASSFRAYVALKLNMEKKT